jgi:hypothetical protein
VIKLEAISPLNGINPKRKMISGLSFDQNAGVSSFPSVAPMIEKQARPSDLQIYIQEKQAG